KAVAKAPDGRVLFIDNADPGDIVDDQTYKKRKAYYQGKVIRYHSLSDKRTPPACPHFEFCGGCTWQNMSYEHQLFYKQKEVENNLKRLGKIALPEINPIMGSDKVYYYRNKVEYTFSNRRWLTPKEIESGEEIVQRDALGYHIPGKWDKILDIEDCHLQRDPSNAIRNAVREFALKNGLSFFDLRKQEGFLRNLMIRTSTTGDVMVLIQFFREEADQRKLLLDFIADRFPAITSLQYVINGKGNDTIYDREVICYRGKDHIVEEMEGLKFKIGAKSFYQTNSHQARELYKVVRDFAQISPDEIVYDLYTGLGSIAQFVARQAQKVIGVEAVPEAIASARENAQLNHIDNTFFFTGDMRKVFTDAFVRENGHPDIVITDPPRVGMHKDVIAQQLKIAPQRMVYVSCNSATQARDLALLDEKYKV